MKRIIVLLLPIVGLVLIIVGIILFVNTREVDLSLGEEFVSDYRFDDSLVDYTKDTLPAGYNNYDFDGDKLTNKIEIELGTDMYKMDSDSDGISDFEEVNNTKTDPLKWSSRDDKVSDLEYVIVNNYSFKEGYSSLDGSGFRVYLTSPKDNLFIISKISTDIFDNLETISEAYQIKNFDGKMALDCSKYVNDVVNNISIYKVVEGKAQLIDSVVEGNNFLSFNVSSGDIFCAVYSKV